MHLQPGQTVLVHGAGGAVGTLAVQMARGTGARVIGTGRERDRARVLEAAVCHPGVQPAGAGQAY